MAAALGDLALVRHWLDTEPECIRMRVNDQCFPKADTRSGGTIYQWELGWHVSACQVARSFGHTEVSQLLMDRSPAEEKLLNACWLHDEPLVDSLLAQDSALAGNSPEGRRQLAHAARNNDTQAARLMLRAGLPVDSTGQHNATPLHWAAWLGNADLVRLLLVHNAPLEDSSNEFSGTPLQWAMHGSENGWHRERGDYFGTVRALLDAGVRVPAEISGTEAVRSDWKKSSPRNRRCPQTGDRCSGILRGRPLHARLSAGCSRFHTRLKGLCPPLAFFRFSYVWQHCCHRPHPPRFFTAHWLAT